MRAPGFYWMTSERASVRGVAQWHDGVWYCINEEGPVSAEEIERRGWRPSEYIGPAKLHVED